ncbi:MAG TPA: DUF3048 C-terminal domain-containing protein [Clostridia bacterium]|nr:DUF3048 C-terminal domain-containing protein [Clostridia bacterium]HPQ47847.1 DUF3048 C-terminal domain-containing protein [Clostridia bacterium]
MKKILVLLLVIAMVLGITACKGKEATESETPDPTATVSPSTEPTGTSQPSESPSVTTDPTESPSPSEEPDEGYAFPDPDVRPWAVSIDNQGEKPFPQGGLSKAQIVYEIPVEGGVTRYLALFWNVEVDLIGPVRSARDYMLDVVMPYDGFLVHVGGSPQVLGEIRNSSEFETLDAMYNAGSIFEDLTDDPKNWQDTFTTGEKVSDFLESKSYDLAADTTGAVMEYHEEMVVPDSSMQANMVSITYSDLNRCAYIYDETRQLYFRNRDGQAHVDKNDGAPFGVTNIIIQKVTTRKISGDAAGRIEVDMVDSGTGYYITGGKSIEITWEKTERFGPTKYYDSEGKEIILNPGNTWIQITDAQTAIMIL